MTKSQEIFLDHFARLGIFTKVQALAGPPEPQEAEETEANPEGKLNFYTLFRFTVSIIFELENKCLETSEQVQIEDAKEILAGKAYHWRDWSICRGRDCLYIWSDAAALELSNGSNGWFRFILDGKLATMYSSGSPEGGADTSGKKQICFYLSAFVCRLIIFICLPLSMFWIVLHTFFMCELFKLFLKRLLKTNNKFYKVT